MSRIGHRLRCYPNRTQEQTLLRWIGCQRFIYNGKVKEDRYFRTFARKALSLTGQKPPIDQRYAQFIGPDSLWLREVPSPVWRSALAPGLQPLLPEARWAPVHSWKRGRAKRLADAGTVSVRG